MCVCWGGFFNMWALQPSRYDKNVILGKNGQVVATQNVILGKNGQVVATQLSYWAKSNYVI